MISLFSNMNYVCLVVLIFSGFVQISFSQKLLIVEKYDQRQLMVMVKEIVIKSLTGKYCVFDVFQHSVKEFCSDDLLESILKNCENVLVQLEDQTFVKRTHDRVKKNSIFLLNDIESFRSFNENINRDVFSFSGNYLFVLVRVTMDDIEEIFATLWKKNIHNVTLVYEEKETVKVFTFMPFEGLKCGDTTPKLIGEFHNGTFQFHKSIESVFPEKFKNLQDCPINVATFEDPLSVIKTNNLDGTYSLSGFDMDLIDELSKILNFKKNIVFTVGKSPYGHVYPNGSVDGALGEVFHGKAEIAAGCYQLHLRRREVLDASLAYHSFPQVFVISSGRSMSNMEKLLQPFQTTVWIFVVTTLSTGVLVVLIVNWKFKKAKRFVYGSKVHHPITNMLIVIFGGSQRRLPFQTFPRFLLMMFVIFCLVLRNAYQGAMFKFMQNDGNQREPETIDELIEEDYEFIVYTPATLEIFEKPFKR
jgi:Ligated ion channel L-glutamate- and glycine-binding site